MRPGPVRASAHGVPPDDRDDLLPAGWLHRMLLHYEHRPRRIGKIRQHMSSEVSRNRCVQFSEIAKAIVYFFLVFNLDIPVIMNKEFILHARNDFSCLIMYNVEAENLYVKIYNY